MARAAVAYRRQATALSCGGVAGQRRRKVVTLSCDLACGASVRHDLVRDRKARAKPLVAPGSRLPAKRVNRIGASFGRDGATVRNRDAHGLWKAAIGANAHRLVYAAIAQ